MATRKSRQENNNPPPDNQALLVVTDEKPQGKRGAKNLLTPELTERICGYLARGHHASNVCKLVCINESTYYRWKVENQAFKEAVEAATALVEDTSLTAIETAIQNGDAKLALEFLSRRFPDTWGRSRVDVGMVKPPKALEDMTDAELEQYIETLDPATKGIS